MSPVAYVLTTKEHYGMPMVAQYKAFRVLDARSAEINLTATLSP